MMVMVVTVTAASSDLLMHNQLRSHHSASVANDYQSEHEDDYEHREEDNKHNGIGLERFRTTKVGVTIIRVTFVILFAVDIIATGPTGVTGRISTG